MTIIKHEHLNEKDHSHVTTEKPTEKPTKKPTKSGDFTTATKKRRTKKSKATTESLKMIKTSPMQSNISNIHPRNQREWFEIQKYVLKIRKIGALE